MARNILAVSAPTVATRFAIDHLSAIANLANELSNVKQIDVEPYHPMGKTKAEQIGHTNAINHIGFVDQTIWNSWIEKIQEQTNIPVCHA